MSNKQIKTEFEKLLSHEPKSSWRDKVTQRKNDKAWLKLSADIALRVLDELHSRKMSQLKLASLMGVTPQQVNKIVKGRENLKLETISKLEQALNVKLITIPDVNEIVVKNDVKSLMQILVAEVMKRQIKVNVQEVLQQTQNIQTLKNPVKHEFTFSNNYVTVAPPKDRAGGRNYAMAA